jgi:PAS domain S-box-containing protein
MTERYLRLLVIEDSEDDTLLVVRELRQGGYEVDFRRVDTAQGMETALASQSWDLIICDYSMPAFSAPNALKVLQDAASDIPFIIVSGTIGEETAVAALKAGAHDFLIKGNFARLLPAIERELRDAIVRRKRKEAERSLQESEAKFRRLVEYLPAVVYISSASEGNPTIYVSPQIKDMLGYTPEEWLADPDLWQKTIHPQDRQKVLTQVMADLQTGSPFDMEYQMVARDGRVVWVRDQSTLVRDKDRQPQFRQGIMLDITNQKQHEQELEAIAAVASILRTPKTLEEILDHLLDEALRLVSAQAGSIWLYDPETRRVRMEASRNWEKGSISSYRLGEGIPGIVVESGQEFVSREFCSEPRIPNSAQAQSPKGVGGACIPLHAADKIVGVMFIHVTLPRELTLLELRVLSTLASIGGNTINSMRLHEQTVQQLERLGALREIDLAISSSLDLRLTLHTVLEQIIKQLRVDAADVLLAKSGSGFLEHIASQGFRTPAIKATSLRLGEGLAGKAAIDREILHIEDLNHNEDAFMRKNLLADEDFVSYFAVPLVAKGEVKGVLEIFHRSRLSPPPEWMNFLDALGWQTAIAIDNALLFEDLQRSNKNLLISYDATIEGWSRALDLRDRETEGHTERVTKFTLQLAQAMGIPEEHLIHIWRGSMLHDIGKMGVPDGILLKPGKLTSEERELMRKHPQFAYDMLKPVRFLREALTIPYYHHEKWDGSGYPHGLKGEMIPLEARIFAVVDVWDALSNDRPYRPAWPREKVIRYIKEQSGKRFDPQVVEKFLELETTWQNSEHSALLYGIRPGS